MKLSEELKWRGFVNQTTISDLKELDSKKTTFYHGFDASADSQTVGNLAAMMLDKTFMRHGHKAIILAGGATSLIGDPGGKDKERVLQDEKTISRNVEKATEQLKKIFSGQDFKLVNNLDWTRDLKVLDFLRDIGKHFSMTPLVQRDYIAKRIGEGGAGISYTEFSYTILQGYDYLHLFDKYGCTLQLGGSDQWGNCLSGVELVRRARGAEVHVITLPLIINKSTGQKFGKSESGAIWLDAQKTHPNDFYQFWLNTDDNSVEDHLKIFTELDKAEIDENMAQFNRDRSNRVAQKTLAFEVTKLVHGEVAAKKAEEEAKTLKNSVAERIKAAEGVSVKADESIVEILVKTNLVFSKSEARRLIQSGGVYVNDKKTSKENFDESDFIDGKLELRRGKKLKDSVVLRLG